MMAEEHNKRGTPWGDDHPPPRKGRPKGARGRKTIVTEIANETHQVTLDGREQRVRTIELVLHALDEAARQGDQRALRECDRLEEGYGFKELGGGLLVVPETPPVELYERMIAWHNRHVVQPDPPEGLY